MLGWFGWNEFDDQIQQSIRFWTRVLIKTCSIFYVRMIWLKWIRWSNSTIDSFWTRVWWNLFNIYVRMIWLKWIRWSNSTIDSFWTRVSLRLVQYSCEDDLVEMNSMIKFNNRFVLNKSLLRLVQYPCEDDLVEMNSMIKFNNQFVLNKSLLRLVQYPCEDDLVEMNSMIKFNNQFVLNKSVDEDLFNIHVRMIWLKWIRWSNSTIDSFWTRVCLDLFNIYVRMIWLKWIRWSNSTINSFWTRVCVRLVQYPCEDDLVEMNSMIKFNNQFVLNKSVRETCSIFMWGWFGWNEFDDQIQQSIRFWTRVWWNLFNIHVRMIWLKWIRWSNSTIDSFWTRVCLDLFNIHVRMIWLKWIRWSNSTINSFWTRVCLRLVQYPCEDDLVEMNSMIKFNNQFVFEQEFIKICSISMWGWFGWNEFDDQIQQSIRFEQEFA